EALKGQKFTELLQEDAKKYEGVETSPFTQESLGITYPIFDIDTLVARSKAFTKLWRNTDVQARAGILMESLEGMKERFNDIAIATMHTSGQGYMMAFQASGPHAADRALEVIALGYEELTRVPRSAEWEKPMGKFDLKVRKTWKAIGKGTGLVVGCSTFPVWNTVPGLYANLIVGNPVIVKPHPGAVLPIAIVVAEIQKALRSNGLDANIVQLAPDTFDDPIAKKLATHEDIKLVDYTGGPDFGNFLENIPGKVVFTEKAGVNSVIIDSVTDIDPIVQNLAFAASLYSGQMCTAPQNIFNPKDGIKTANGMHLSFEEVAAKFVEAIKNIAGHPKMGPGTLGAIQNLNTSKRIGDAKKSGKVLLESSEVANEEFPGARTASPLVLEMSSSDKALFSEELFGPIVILVKTENTAESISLAKELAIAKGAISCGAYSTDKAVRDHIAAEMEESFTPVTFNFTGPIWMNQNAAFSDFHVTGGNPAGNASFADAAFIVRRFVWVGHKEIL
ncbi:MAG: aldehyde dehydrogenase family protein, partial [Bacteroidota bacterium]|nr:aldehyde dehydrogenase family protein [Bacteroidota bacterium]